MVRDLASKAEVAHPTVFHQFLEDLAKSGRLLRHYTQNIDCIECSLPTLSPDPGSDDRVGNTVQLHGRLDRVVCHLCQWLGVVDWQLFEKGHQPPCPRCEDRSSTRVSLGKRAISIGRLRPNIVLYGEDVDPMIDQILTRDLDRRPDAFIVAGSALKVPGARSLAKGTCQAVQARRGGLTVWIDRDNVSADGDIRFDYLVREDCDTVAAHFQR